MLEDAIDAAEQDVDHRMLIESRVEAEQVVAALRKAIAMTESCSRTGSARSRGAELEASLGGEDRQKIRPDPKLDETSAPFAQRRIERDLQVPFRALSPRGGGLSPALSPHLG